MISSPQLWGLLVALACPIDLQDLKLPEECLPCWRRVEGRWEARTCVSSTALNIITVTSILFCVHLPGHSGFLVPRQILGLRHSAIRAEQRAKEEPPAPASEEAAGEDARRRLADAVPVAGVSAGDPERGGAAGVPGAVLLLGQHSGLSRAGAAQRAQEYSPQH